MLARFRMNLNILRYISYVILLLIALYLAYMITTRIIWLFWMLITILIYGGLLITVAWFLHKQGFFELFKSVEKSDHETKL